MKILKLLLPISIILIVVGILLTMFEPDSFGSKEKHLYSDVDDIFVSNDVVYAVGSISEGTSETDCPTLWIDNNPQTIGSIGNFNTASDIYVDKNDIYVIYTDDRFYYLKKNGENIDIPGATELSSVYVNDGDVYVAGKYGGKPAIWINGEPHCVSSSSGCMTDLVIYDNKVYAVGYIGSYYFPSAILWRDGEIIEFGEDKTTANAIEISDGNIYIVGEKNDCATLWVNLEPYILEYDKSSAYAVAVLGDDIYVGGQGFSYDGRSESRLWKNGELLEQSKDMGYQIMSLTVASDKLYVGGTGKDIVPIWEFE